MRPRLAERAVDCERERRIPQETIDELHDAGFFRYYLPSRWGGAGGSLTGLIDIGAELARGCPSTAWVFTIVSEVTGVAGTLLPPEGVEAIYGSSRRPAVCGVHAMNGTARRVDGGYVISGTWGFASGCRHAGWFAGGTAVVADSGETVDQVLAFLPMSDLMIKDTWHVAGMRGTGSHTVVAEDVFVPAHLAWSIPERLRRETRFVPGAEVIDRIPLAPFFSIGLMGPLLGIAQEILEVVGTQAHKRGVSYFDFERQTDSASLLAAIGEAAIRVDTAWLHVHRAAAELEETTRSRTLDYATRARCRADAGHACENLRQAADSLLSIAGSSAFAESNRLQALWRDLNVASRHGFLNTRLLYEAYGRAHAGVEPNITEFI
jgi:alkylation response protein AidB-like acyl-CoA dehydrogenase